MSFVRIDHVAKSFGDLQVLNHISLSISEGEFITLLGPSGCGKSTLLRAIAGLNEIDSGLIYVGDKEITHLPSKDREVGMVFQSYALFPNMNVYHNIAFGLKMDKMPKSEIRALVDEIIEVVDLKGKENMYPNQLSGGQQQRVALARALVKKPKILLLDEPLSALDAKIRRTLRNEIRLIQRKFNITTVFVTHDQEEALTISDRVFVMNHGNIEQSGSPEAIYKEPATEFVARFIGNYNVVNKADLHKAGLHALPQGELFAIRPEALSIRPENETSPIDSSAFMESRGKIVLSTLLGNVMRYDMEMNGISLTVDALHDHSTSWVRDGLTVRVVVPIKECKALKKSS